MAKFGLAKFRQLVESLYGADEFADKFQQMEEGIYARMNDLQSATQAEWAKVLNMMSTMTYHLAPESPLALVEKKDYAFSDIGGVTAVEISMRNAYMKYRGYCRQSAIKPLFQGEQAFMHSIKDCPALMNHGVGTALVGVPGIYTFDVLALTRLNVEPFKGGT